MEQYRKYLKNSSLDSLLLSCASVGTILKIKYLRAYILALFAFAANIAKIQWPQNITVSQKIDETCIANAIQVLKHVYAKMYKYIGKQSNMDKT